MSENISRLRQKIVRTRVQRARLEDKALRSQMMVMGSFLGLMRKCGKAGCKCGRGELHGPNFYLSLPKAGKRSRMVPVGQDKVKLVKTLNSRYHDFQRGLTEIRRLNQEIELLLLAIREEQLRLGEEKAGLPGLPSA